MPDDPHPPFRWGTTSTAVSSEGAAPRSTWAAWEAAGRAPRSGDGNGFARRYPSDLALLADAGLRTLRMGVDWARIEPWERRPDGAAFEHYREVLRAARDAGVDVWVCLHDDSLPGWFADDLGGFRDRRARTSHWARHVDRVAETLGDLVAGWIPVGEPLAHAERAHLTGTEPPGRRDPRRFVDTLAATHLAAIDAWRLLRSGTQPVATAMDLSIVVARATTADPDAAAAARRWTARADQLMWGWTRLLRDGVLAVPGHAEVEIPDAAGAFDLIGFTYRPAATIDETATPGPYPTDLPAGPLGHVDWAGGLRGVIERLADELAGRPLLVTGFGVDTPTARDDDDLRCRLMAEAADIVASARHAGVDLRGLWWRTGIDGYDTRLGFDVASGLFDRDRAPKPSAHLATELATRA